MERMQPRVLFSRNYYIPVEGEQEIFKDPFSTTLVFGLKEMVYQELAGHVESFQFRVLLLFIFFLHDNILQHVSEMIG